MGPCDSKVFRHSTAFLVSISGLTLPAGAQECFAEQVKFMGDGTQNALFGVSVSIAGDTALVGARGDDGNGVELSGSAYVFVRSGADWSQAGTLTASDGSEVDRFGQSVSVSVDRALVGADWDDGISMNQGSAYVFLRNGTSWIEEAKLTASDAFDGEHLGYSVALSDDTALVSAPGVNADSGAAYVFVWSGTSWVEEAKLTASDGAAYDQFGSSVSLSGDTALIGADGDHNGFSTGSAYVFVRSGTAWAEEAKLTASDGAEGDRFGSSVSLSEDTALIGAFLDDDASGAAYVFVRDGTGWIEEAKLTDSSGTNDAFGSSVSIAGDRALIEAGGDDELGSSSGAAYIFLRSGSGWTQEAKLTASDGQADGNFGTCSMSGDTALVGAWGHDQNGTNVGAAYVFVPLAACGSYCTAGVSVSGCRASISAMGTPSATAPAGFLVRTWSVEGQKDGLYFFGTNGKQANPWGNGTSYQCVVPPVIRAPIMTGTGTLGLCDGSFAFDLNAFWCPSCPKPAKNPGAAATVQAQLWYRDPASFSNQTTSLSDAVEFVVAP